MAMSDEAIISELSGGIDELLRLLDQLDRVAGRLHEGRPSDLTRINAAQRRARLLLSKTLVTLDRLDPELRELLQRDRARRVA